MAFGIALVLFAAAALAVFARVTENTVGADGRVKGPFDAALLISDAEVVPDTGDGEHVIDLGDQSAAVPHKLVMLEAMISAIKTTAGNETYRIEVFESAAADSGFLTCGVYVVPVAVGQIVKPVAITKRYVKLTYTLAGTNPSMTITAYLSYV